MTQDLQATVALDMEKRSVAEFWDANPCGGGWTSYREWLDWYRATEPYIFNFLRKYDWKDVRTLDIGCGQGAIANHLMPLGAEITAIDISERSLRRAAAGAEELRQRLELITANARQLPFADASFDRVISAGVLHHTADIDAGVGEIERVLQPGGTAIVMLYRRANPKWWATAVSRAVFRAARGVSRRPDRLLEKLRRRQEEGDAGGTALLELFDVPILNAYSNRQCRHIFRHFVDVRISNHQAGFRRLADVFPPLQRARPVLEWVDAASNSTWGFYQVIEARRATRRA